MILMSIEKGQSCQGIKQRLFGNLFRIAKHKGKRWLERSLIKWLLFRHINKKKTLLSLIYRANGQGKKASRFFLQKNIYKQRVVG